MGVPIGNDGHVPSELHSRACKVCALVRKCMNLPLSKQTHFLLPPPSLSVHMFRPLDGPNRSELLVSWRALFDDCVVARGWPEAVHGFHVKSLHSVPPVVQRDVARCLAARQGKVLLASCDCATVLVMRDPARLRSAASAPASAWITGTPGPTTCLGDETFVVCGRHRMGLGVPTSVDPPPCLCGAGCASTPEPAMVCTNVHKMSQMRHEFVPFAV